MSRVSAAYAVFVTTRVFELQITRENNPSVANYWQLQLYPKSNLFIFEHVLEKKHANIYSIESSTPKQLPPTTDFFCNMLKPCHLLTSPFLFCKERRKSGARTVMMRLHRLLQALRYLQAPSMLNYLPILITTSPQQFFSSFLVAFCNFRPIFSDVMV